jgi:DNA ligase (NAD+)
MSQPRAALQKQAKAYGIGVSSSVSSKTDFLIIGENVGQSKLKAAKVNDVVILTEEEYLKILNTQ